MFRLRNILVTLLVLIFCTVTSIQVFAQDSQVEAMLNGQVVDFNLGVLEESLGIITDNTDDASRITQTLAMVASAQYQNPYETSIIWFGCGATQMQWKANLRMITFYCNSEYFSSPIEPVENLFYDCLHRTGASSCWGSGENLHQITYVQAQDWDSTRSYTGEELPDKQARTLLLYMIPYVGSYYNPETGISLSINFERLGQETVVDLLPMNQS